MIILSAAVPLETELLRRELAPCEVRRCGGVAVYQGTLAGQSVALQHSGVGKANAAATTALLLEKLQPEAVLCFGCAGAYLASGLKVGDLIVASEEIYGDEGAAAPDGFLDMRALGFPLAERDGERWFNRFPADQELLTLGHRLISEACASGQRVARGPLVTVSTCSGTAAAGNLLARRTDGLGENMEGAAVAHLCARYGVPFFEVRGISNLVEDRDLSRWDLPAAVMAAQQAVRTVLAGWSERQEPA
ncbi:MAG: futalosine hydrolase [Desulfuromonadales bacterium]|nr:futalosine hydrolase [Desulfuromonadales bacterium]